MSSWLTAVRVLKSRPMSCGCFELAANCQVVRAIGQGEFPSDVLGLASIRTSGS